MKTTRISVRLDRGLRASIRKRAKAAGRREGEMIREALQREFQEQPAQKSPTTWRLLWDSSAVLRELPVISVPNRGIWTARTQVVP